MLLLKKGFFVMLLLFSVVLVLNGCQTQELTVEKIEPADPVMEANEADAMEEVPEDLQSDEHGTEVLEGEAEEHQLGEMVSYGEDFNGYLVRPVEEGTYPGVILIHEWWGLNQNIKNMAHDLAEEGFVALAVDLYDGRLADNTDDARTYATEVRNNMDRALSHMKTAVNI